MSRLKTSKKSIALIVIVLLIVSVAIFAKLLFWNSSYSSPKYKFSAGFLNKILKAQENGGNVELSKEDVNGVISVYFKQYRTNNLVIKSVEADFKDDNMVFYVPITYKGFNLFLWSQGDISLEKGKIKYTPDYFKLGKITVPKSYVLKKLQTKLKDRVALDGNSITIDISKLPIGITGVSVKNQKLLVTLEKRQINIEDILKGKLSSSLQNFIKKFPNIENLGSSVKISSESTNTKAKNNGSQIISGSKNSVSPERQQTLDRVSSGLSAASGSVSTGAQKSIISQMMSVVNNMKDSSYNPYSEEGSVRAAYSKLSPREKAELQAAIVSNVDSSALDMLSSMVKN